MSTGSHRARKSGRYRPTATLVASTVISVSPTAWASSRKKNRITDSASVNEWCSKRLYSNSPKISVAIPMSRGMRMATHGGTVAEKDPSLAGRLIVASYR